MKRGDLDDLAAFAVVARTRSFTRAAAEIGLSPSALSHAMRGLEQRLGVTLLARTTRSVAPTAAGRQLLHALEPALAGLAEGLASLENWRDTPTGNIRLTTLHYASRTILADKLPAFLRDHPDVTIEVTIDDRLTDIVAGGFDAGIRPGGAVENDMIAIRLEPDSRACVVGTPGYFVRHPRPQSPQDLQDHRCINYRRVTTGEVVPWRFERNGETINVRTQGQLIVNDGVLAGATIRSGAGLGSMLEHEVAEEIADGRLISVLDEWSPVFHGCHLYYPNRQITPALRALVEALRWKDK
ncbi:LysR family transcriptional regulator [Citrobacter koseri]|uniref:LysR family transcriptional regulator n=1 Tax=Citrobacter koseri TaxID=545 RepID=UPI0029434105|nr:LysR family transcriptional regulator [Citrobacter koseri]WOJ03058.1 LysR family transcriptional regulator [Citrobacter koseri]